MDKKLPPISELTPCFSCKVQAMETTGNKTYCWNCGCRTLKMTDEEHARLMENIVLSQFPVGLPYTVNPNWREVLKRYGVSDEEIERVGESIVRVKSLQ